MTRMRSEDGCLDYASELLKRIEKLESENAYLSSELQNCRESA